jgi:hypothetical protein
MTALFGTDTEFSVLADSYYALALSPLDDKIWGTNIPYTDLVERMKITDGQEDDPKILQAYTNLVDGSYNQMVKSTNPDAGCLYNQGGMRIGSRFSDEDYGRAQYSDKPRTNVWQLMQRIPQISDFSAMCAATNWSDKLTGEYEKDRWTIFAPTNDAMRKAKNSWLTTTNRHVLRELCKAHTSNFALKWNSMIKRKLEVYTVRDGFSFVVDGTGRFKNSVNVYQKPYGMLNFEYPIGLERFDIVQAYETDNGNVYIIDGVFSPAILV